MLNYYAMMNCYAMLNCNCTFSYSDVFALQESERLVNAEDKLMKLQVDRDKFETQLTVRFSYHPKFKVLLFGHFNLFLSDKSTMI